MDQTGAIFVPVLAQGPAPHAVALQGRVEFPALGALPRILQREEAFSLRPETQAGTCLNI